MIKQRTNPTAALCWLLLAVAATGISCKSPQPLDPAALSRADGGGDARRDGPAGGNGGSGGVPGQSGNGGNGGGEGVLPDAGTNPGSDAVVVGDAPVDGPPDPTCVANVPCTQGIAPCRQGATTCATPTSQAVCTDVGADDTRGGCTGGNVCQGGACRPPCATSVPCTEGIKPCRKGATTCATPTSPAACADVGADDSKGGCTGGQVCSNGSCVAPCAPNQPCSEGIGACHRGTTSCASPSSRPACNPVVDDSRGGCTGGNICRSGACVAPPPVTCDGQPIGAGRCSGTTHQTCGANGQWANDNSAECKRADGGQCSTGSDCKSGNCASGICCDSACTGKCMSCTGADTGRANGNCAPVRAGADPRNQCASTSESSCGTDGACDGAGECRFHATSVVCAGATCSGGSATPARRCTGRGSCAPASGATSCGEFPCGANGQCATSCPNGQVPQGGKCVTPCTNPGAACNTNNPCTTGTIVCTGNGPVCQPKNKPDYVVCGNFFMCLNGACKHCGGRDELCCSTDMDDLCVSRDLTCDNSVGGSRCRPCGGNGQWCCGFSAEMPSGCNGTLKCDTNSGDPTCVP